MILLRLFMWYLNLSSGTKIQLLVEGDDVGFSGTLYNWTRCSMSRGNPKAARKALYWLARVAKADRKRRMNAGVKALNMFVEGGMPKDLAAQLVSTMLKAGKDPIPLATKYLAIFRERCER